ncbi:MAG TPA: glycoside hydrolase family 3 C-terminal domain-containing protein [Pyrinomonadaceae bacterium]|jgi:beta-glucosidase|nr:glycoside hydrolase family 3 C-terminal domain-containing protein [Pyrinomonadaceae bacterium]
MNSKRSRRRFLKQTSVATLAAVVGDKVPTLFASDRLTPQLSIEQRVDQLIRRMTLAEKIQMVHGVYRQGFIGYIPGIPRLGIPELALTDGPAGVRHGPGTAFPAPVAVAATWDRSLAQQYGAALGAEAKAKGQNILLGPMVNIVRVPEGGRNFETFGEDPYLTSQLAAAEIRGIQGQGVIAEVKHYAANNQEAERLKVSAEVDERTLREIYLPAFEAAVKDGKVGSVMAAYNKVNGTFSSENVHLLKDVLKDEWGFDGFVVSDWGATHSTADAANNGLDIEMPTGEFFGDKLMAAVKEGRVTEATIDDKVRRILRVITRFGFLERPPEVGPLDYRRQAEIGRRVAEAGVVLLKNEKDILPLDVNNFKSVAVIGAFADSAASGGGGSARITPLNPISPLGAIANRIGKRATFRFLKFVAGSDLSKSDPATTGAGLLNDATELAKACDVALVFARDFESEGVDRANIVMGMQQDELIREVVNANPRTVVVLNTGCMVLVHRWADAVLAIVQAWYPGQDDGEIIADVLFGNVNPSGKLPITFPKRREDTGITTAVQYPGVNGLGRYSEGVFVGYRHFDKEDITPQFPFGHGLSYTTFEYSNLKLSRTQIRAGESVAVEVQVKNTGSRDGAEVVQLYVQDINASLPRPVKELKGFEKVSLKRGETKLVRINLDPRSMAYYDPSKKQWVVEPGTFKVLIGSSSRLIKLTAQFNVVS